MVVEVDVQHNVANARAFASRWVSRGTGAHEEAPSSSTSLQLTLTSRRQAQGRPGAHAATAFHTFT